MQKVSNIIQITAGEQHISMLDADGSVWSTGYNGYGQFGIGTADTYNVLPTQMKDTKGSILYGVKRNSIRNISYSINKRRQHSMECRI